jgi:hypothetical protein
MSIQPAYVTFEQAKLLKEKGFDVPTCNGYDSKGNLICMASQNRPMDYNTQVLLYSMPEQWQVIEWLRVKYGIHIEILLAEDNPWNKFYYRVMKVGEYFTLSHDGIHRETPQEAYSAAFDYIFQNIKLSVKIAQPSA